MERQDQLGPFGEFGVYVPRKEGYIKRENERQNYGAAKSIGSIALCEYDGRCQGLGSRRT